jgi:hypothetical protein
MACWPREFASLLLPFAVTINVEVGLNVMGKDRWTIEKSRVRRVSSSCWCSAGSSNREECTRASRRNYARTRLAGLPNRLTVRLLRLGDEQLVKAKVVHCEPFQITSSAARHIAATMSAS